ncbi:MAG: capsule biosynthesis protein [Candidatus Rokuibacteriota bacterium]
MKPVERLGAWMRAALKRSPAVRQVVYRRRLHTGQPDWRRALERDGRAWREARTAAAGGPGVLVATSVGAMLAATNVDSALAAALTLRGARVHFLLCDGALPACLNCVSATFPRLDRFADTGPAAELCSGCFGSATRALDPLGLPMQRYGDHLAAEDFTRAEHAAATVPCADIPHHKADGVSVGEHALAGALRFFARGTLESEPLGETVLRRYFRAALLTVTVAQRLLRTGTFECVVLHHGIYVPQGMIAEVARREGVRVVTWNPAYRKRCFVFSHDDTYHHTLMNEPVDRWEDIPWTTARERRLLDYLKTRAEGSEDWIWFHEAPQENIDMVERALGVSFARPVVGLLTNVAWDAQLHYPARAFPGQTEWLLTTIDYFARRPDLQLVIRIHPAEVRGTIPSRERMADVIRKAWPTLPPNVFIVPPESPISTYAVMVRCDAVLIYGTKTGVELTSVGVPVIVAGEAWIRNKGIALDVESPAHYFTVLDELPLRRRITGDQLVRARKYAYHFFFRRMIPLDCMAPRRTPRVFPPYRLRVANLDSLRPGASAGLDVVCDGILRGTDFIFRDEDVPSPGSTPEP